VEADSEGVLKYTLGERVIGREERTSRLQKYEGLGRCTYAHQTTQSSPLAMVYTIVETKALKIIELAWAYIQFTIIIRHI
jgi:hypothetical protein